MGRLTDIDDDHIDAWSPPDDGQQPPAGIMRCTPACSTVKKGLVHGCMPIADHGAVL